MNFGQTLQPVQLDSEELEKIYSRLRNEPEVIQALLPLYVQLCEMNPGERFTRYAKKDLREKQKQQLQAFTQMTLEKKVENPPVKTSLKGKKLQLSKAFSPKTIEPVAPKEVQEVLVEDYQKILDIFQKIQPSIKPHSSLATFTKVPILDINRKPYLESLEKKKPHFGFAKSNRD